MSFSVEDKISAYRKAHPGLKTDQIIEKMVTSGALSCSEAEKISAFIKTESVASDIGTRLEHKQDKALLANNQVQNTQLTEMEAKDLSIEYLSENIQSAIDLLKNTDDGVVSKGYDAVKNFLNTELSSKNVGEVLDKELDSVSFLTKAKENKLTKREYYEQNKERLKKMILKRFNDKDDTGVSFLDKLKGDFSEAEFAKTLDDYIIQTVDTISTMKGIKDAQHKLLMQNEEENSAFLTQIAERAKLEKSNEFSVEGQHKKLPSISPQEHPFESEELMTFEETFELERGTKFDKDSFVYLQQSKGEMNFATGAHNKNQELKNSVKLLLDEYHQETKVYVDTDGNSVGGNEPSAEQRALKIAGLFKDYYASAPDNAKKDLDIIIKKQQLDLKVIQDERGNLSVSFGDLYKDDFQKNRALNTLLKVSTQEQDKKLTKLLDGKSYESYIQKYQTDYENAFGKQNIDELTKAMHDDQMTVVQKYTGIASMGGMAIMVVGGVLTLTPAAPLGTGMVATGGKIAMTGMAAKNILGFTEELSRKQVSDERMLQLKKDFVLDLGGMIIGGAAGRQGLKYANQIMKNSADKIAAVIAEKGTDFTISVAGDLAMIGALNYDEGLSETLKNNGIGIVVSTLTGIKASKEMFKNNFDAVPQTKTVFVQPEEERVITKHDFEKVETASLERISGEGADESRSLEVQKPKKELKEDATFERSVEAEVKSEQKKVFADKDYTIVSEHKFSDGEITAKLKAYGFTDENINKMNEIDSDLANFTTDYMEIAKDVMDEEFFFQIEVADKNELIGEIVNAKKDLKNYKVFNIENYEKIKDVFSTKENAMETLMSLAENYKEDGAKIIEQAVRIHKLTGEKVDDGFKNSDLDYLKGLTDEDIINASKLSQAIGKDYTVLSYSDYVKNANDLTPEFLESFSKEVNSLKEKNLDYEPDYKEKDIVEEFEVLKRVNAQLTKYEIDFKELPISKNLIQMLLQADRKNNSSDELYACIKQLSPDSLNKRLGFISNGTIGPNQSWAKLLNEIEGTDSYSLAGKDEFIVKLKEANVKNIDGVADLLKAYKECRCHFSDDIKAYVLKDEDYSKAVKLLETMSDAGQNYTFMSSGFENHENIDFDKAITAIKTIQEKGLEKKFPIGGYSGKDYKRFIELGNYEDNIAKLEFIDEKFSKNEINSYDLFGNKSNNVSFEKFKENYELHNALPKECQFPPDSLLVSMLESKVDKETLKHNLDFWVENNTAEYKTLPIGIENLDFKLTKDMFIVDGKMQQVDHVTLNKLLSIQKHSDTINALIKDSGVSKQDLLEGPIFKIIQEYERRSDFEKGIIVDILKKDKHADYDLFDYAIDSAKYYQETCSSDKILDTIFDMKKDGVDCETSTRIINRCADDNRNIDFESVNIIKDEILRKAKLLNTSPGSVEWTKFVVGRKADKAAIAYQKEIDEFLQTNKFNSCGFLFDPTIPEAIEPLKKALLKMKEAGFENYEINILTNAAPNKRSKPRDVDLINKLSDVAVDLKKAGFKEYNINDIIGTMNKDAIYQENNRFDLETIDEIKDIAIEQMNSGSNQYEIVNIIKAFKNNSYNSKTIFDIEEVRKLLPEIKEIQEKSKFTRFGYLLQSYRDENGKFDFEMYNKEKPQVLSLAKKGLVNIPQIIEFCKNDAGDVESKYLNKFLALDNIEDINQYMDADFKAFLPFSEQNSIRELNKVQKRDLIQALLVNKGLFTGQKNKMKDIIPLIPTDEAGYTLMMNKLCSSLNISLKEKTPEQIRDFNTSIKELSSYIQNSDLSELNEISLQMPQKELVKKFENAVSNLSPEEQYKIQDYFGMQIKDGKLSGYPDAQDKDLSSLGISDSQTIDAIKSVKPIIEQYTNNNFITVKDIPELNNNLKKISKTMPELFNQIDGSNDFVKIIKILQKITKNPKFSKLSDSDKKVLTIASILHNTDKSSGFTKESAFDSYFIAKKFGLSEPELKKLYTIVESSDLIEKFMNTTRAKTVKNYRKQKIEGVERIDTFDLLAFKLKEGNDLELAQLLYASKENDGLTRYLDKHLESRINQIKSADFVLPQTPVDVVKEHSNPQSITKGENTYNVNVVAAADIPDLYVFVHTPENAVATGGSRGMNLASVESFMDIADDKVICTSYVSSQATGTFARHGLVFDVQNDKQYVGTGYDMFSLGKNIPDMIVEYYRDKGIKAQGGRGSKFKHRNTVSEFLKTNLSGQDYEALNETLVKKTESIKNRYIYKMKDLKNKIKNLNDAAEKKNEPLSENAKKFIDSFNKKLEELQAAYKNDLENIPEKSIIETIDNDYIQRLDKLKNAAKDNTLTLDKIKEVDPQLYDAYQVLLQKRAPKNDLHNLTSFMNGHNHNEILVSNPKVSAIYTKDLNNIPEEYLRKAQDENLPIILLNKNPNDN